MPDLPPMGEADIKFTRWADHFGGDTIAFSVDGDFIPIALMHHEHQLRNVQAGGAYRLCLYRLRYRMPTPSAKKAPVKGDKPRLSASSAKKQAAKGGKPQEEAAVPEAPARPAAREYEYVNIPALYYAMLEAFQRMTRCCAGASTSGSAMKLLAILMGLGGTDFSRGLPLIGPYTLWDMVCSNPRLSEALVRAYNRKKGLVRTADATNGLVCQIYMIKFSAHFAKGSRFSTTPEAARKRKTSPNAGGAMDRFLAPCKKAGPPPSGSGAAGQAADQPEESDEDPGAVESDSEDFAGGFKAMVRALKDSGNSKLSAKTLEAIPSFKRVDTTFRNINWLIQYWECR
jgi:hypothetical protein